MTYKHRDIVIAWMDGETIQFKNYYGEWVDRIPFESLLYNPNLGMPSEHLEYRIKPKPVMIRHYVYKHTPKAYPCLAVKGWQFCDNTLAIQLERRPDILWLDDWHEASFKEPAEVDSSWRAYGMNT